MQTAEERKNMVQNVSHNFVLKSKRRDEEARTETQNTVPTAGENQKIRSHKLAHTAETIKNIQ